MTKPKKKPAKKAKKAKKPELSIDTLALRLKALRAHVDMLLKLSFAHAEQLDKHQRTLELFSSQREQFVVPGPSALGGFGGPQ